MSLDITPQVGSGRQLIESYGDGRFRIAGRVHEGSVLVFPDITDGWPVTTAGSITAESLERVIAAETPPQILVIGCGNDFLPPPRGLAAALRPHGIVMEWMDTGAACRTFNVLLTEDRAAAAALIAVD